MAPAKTWILGIAIAVIYSLFIGFGISAFYTGPDMETLCQGIPYELLTDNCTEFQKGVPRPIQPAAYIDSCWCQQDCTNGTCIPTGPCYRTNPERQACEQRFYDSQEAYSRNVFIIASVLGLVAMLVGGFVLGHVPVSPGLMGGGLITIIYGTIRYWRYADDKLRVLILGIALAVLIYLAYAKWPGRNKP